ncbi:MAG: hypothetical protein K2J63_02240, partial [Muribaculaceae bacterium]|nr:hypothetical protein [Muribaculaceae bacterium]
MKAVRGGIQIGGRNLLKNSSVAKSASYYLGSYDLSEPWEIGQTYVMTIYGNLGNDAGPYFRVWDGRGFATIITCSKVSDGIYRGFFSPVTMQREYTKQERSVLKIYTSSNQAVSKSSISKVMFERGNIATDYTPAPEDIASGSWGGNWFITNYLQFKHRRIGERRCA